MKTEQFLNYTPTLICGCKQTKGELFGVELELEGRGVALQDVATRGWTRHNDGSLRGEHNEFCTAGPKTFDETQKLVKDLFKKFKDNGVRINDSIRTSTHVHLNFSDKKMKDVVNFFVLFTVLEEVLAYYCGEDRKGNVFCLSTRDAEGIVGVLAEALSSGDFHRFAGDRYKYAACNLSSLYKFGTVEIRTMRGAKTEEEVNNWVSILNDMVHYSLKMKSPIDIINNLSYLGAEGLLREIFSKENYDQLMKTFPKLRTLHASLMEGARIVQVFSYEFDPAFRAEVKPDVAFGEAAVPLAGGLPLRWPDRRMPCVYRPDGTRWNCLPVRRGRRNGDFWVDGESCSDDNRIVWREAIGRFVWGPTGAALNWSNHPVLADEGPPRPIQRIDDDWENDDEDNDEDF